MAGEKTYYWRDDDEVLKELLGEEKSLTFLVLAAVTIALSETANAINKHGFSSYPEDVLSALQGEVAELEEAISKERYCGQHGYMMEVSQVAAVAIKGIVAGLLHVGSQEDAEGEK